MAKQKQLQFLRNSKKEYGGDLLKKRIGRSGGRPVSTQHTMHFVLRSTQATGAWSFTRHQKAIRRILERFALKNGVRLKSMANVGNHIHIHLQLTNRHSYRAFIRAVTSAIMMAVTGLSRWHRPTARNPRKFWDRRPFSRIVVGFKALLTLSDYILINQLESQGYARSEGRFLLQWQKDPQFNSG